MRRLTLALLSGAYICIALITALLAARMGGGAALAAFLGALGLCFAAQGVFARLAQNDSLAREVMWRQDTMGLMTYWEPLQSKNP